MSDISDKLNQIINSLDSVQQRLDNLEKRFTSIENWLTKNETRISKMENCQANLELLVDKIQNQLNEIKIENELAKNKQNTKSSAETSTIKNLII